MSGLWRGWISLEGGNGLYTGSFSLWNGDSGLIDDPVSGARIALSGTTVAENASLSTVIGALSVLNGSGTYTYSITADPDNKFALSGDDLINDGTFNYEAATSHSVTIEADNGVDAPVSRTFTINVTNVYEAASLSALALDDTDITVDTAATVNITGATSGSTITLLSGSLPTGMTLNSGARTIAGTPTAEGESTFTLRETLADSANSPRDTALSLTVSAAAVLTAPTLTLTSDVGRVPVTWGTTADATIFEGYTHRVQVSASSDFATLEQDIYHEIVGGELDGPSFDLSGDGYSEPLVGTHYYRARYERDDGEVSAWSPTMTVVVYDFVPSAFSFTDQTDLDPSTLVYSNSITVLGVSAGATCEWSLTGSGFEAQVNGTGAWATSGTCELNDTIQQRGTTSASDDTPLSGVLDIEGVTDTWTIRTAVAESAVVVTHRSTQNRGYSFGSTPSSAWSSFTIEDGDKVVLHVFAQENVGTLSAVTANGGAITFTQSGSTVSNGNNRISIWYADTTGVTSITPAFTVGSSVYGMSFAAFSVKNAAAGASANQYLAIENVGGANTIDMDGGLAADVDGPIVLTLAMSAGKPPIVWTGATEIDEVDDVTSMLSSALQTEAANVTVNGQPLGGPGFANFFKMVTKWNAA